MSGRKQMYLLTTHDEKKTNQLTNYKQTQIRRRRKTSSFVHLMGRLICVNKNFKTTTTTSKKQKSHLANEPVNIETTKKRIRRRKKLNPQTQQITTKYSTNKSSFCCCWLQPLCQTANTQYAAVARRAHTRERKRASGAKAIRN